MNQEILSLRRNSSDLLPLLSTARVLRHGQIWFALPREVVLGPLGVESVVFEVSRLSDLNRPSLFRVLLKASRLETLTLTLMPCLAVLFGALREELTVSWAMFFLSVLGVLLLQIAVNGFNDVEDHLRLLDLPRNLDGSGVIQRGWMSPQGLRLYSYAMLGCGVALGIAPVMMHPRVLLGVAAIGTLGVFAYSNRPFEMKYRALGDLLIFFLTGPLLAIGFSESVFGDFNGSSIWIGFFFGFLSWAAYQGAHLQSIEKDSVLGVATVASKLGFKKARHLFAALYGFAFLIILLAMSWGAVPKWATFPTLIGFFAAAQVIKKVYLASGPASAHLGGIRLSVLKIHFWLGGLLCSGLGIAALKGL